MREEAQVFLDALQRVGDKFDDGLERVHKRIDEIGTVQAEQSNRSTLFIERLTNHIERKDIHFPQPPEGQSCGKCGPIEEDLQDHLENHSEKVKSDIASLIGKPIVGALLLALAAAAVAGIKMAF